MKCMMCTNSFLIYYNFFFVIFVFICVYQVYVFILINSVIIILIGLLLLIVLSLPFASTRARYHTRAGRGLLYSCINMTLEMIR